MKKFLVTLLIAFLVIGLGSSSFSHDTPTDPDPGVQEKAAVASPFDIMMDVVSHKRCINCHPAGDRPRQGEDSHIHHFNVQRGPEGHGMEVVQCSTCHQSENNNFSGLPGAPHWHLAPRSMAWEGLSRVEIAQAILDRTKNGDRSQEDLLEHMTKDPLVLWVFDPGVNNEGVAREKPPVSKEDYIKAVTEWFEEGAKIPAE